MQPLPNLPRPISIRNIQPTVESHCLGFLLIILGNNGSGNYYFWLKTDRLKNYFRPKEAQTGLKLGKTEKTRKTEFLKYSFGRNGSIESIFSPAETKAMRFYGMLQPATAQQHLPHSAFAPTSNRPSNIQATTGGQRQQGHIHRACPRMLSACFMRVGHQLVLSLLGRHLSHLGPLVVSQSAQIRQPLSRISGHGLEEV
jgi:hypothetical protein